MEYRAHDLIYNYTESMAWQLPEGEHSVQFDDGIIILTKPQIVMSWYYWSLYRCFPGATLISAGAISGYYTSGVHKKLGGLLVWHVFAEHEFSNKYTVWDISKVFLEVANTIYNVSCTHLAEYVTSASLHDLMELIHEPEIVKAKANYKRVCVESKYLDTVVSPAIKEVHAQVSQVLFKDPSYLPHNGIKKLCLTGLVNRGQMIQLIGPRGYVNDIDGSVFPLPIDGGYGEAMDTLYDSIIESRSASRASLMNTVPLQQSEWFNRKVQLAATVIMEAVPIEGGCTSYVTISHLVDQDDLALLKGKYHMVDNVPVLIWDTIDDIIDTRIQLRTITGCGCHDVQNVCTICLGRSSYTIPPGTNLGYALATPLCAIISQIIMSTKHYEVSSASLELLLTANDAKWVKFNAKSPNKLFLTDFAVTGNVLIRIDSDYVRHISQIMHVDVSELPASRITKIPNFGITHTDKMGNLLGAFDELQLAVSGTGVHLSVEALTYLKDHGWGSGKGYIEFNLRSWNKNLPFLVVPRKGDDIMTFFGDVKSFIEPEKKTDIKITESKTRGDAVGKMIEILRRRLNKGNGQEFNIIQVEVFVRAMMMISYSTKQYGLPHPTQEFEFASLKQVIINRSLTSMLAYQQQAAALLQTEWQTNPQKTRHLLDPLLRI